MEENINKNSKIITTVGHFLSAGDALSRLSVLPSPPPPTAHKLHVCPSRALDAGTQLTSRELQPDVPRALRCSRVNSLSPPHPSICSSPMFPISVQTTTILLISQWRSLGIILDPSCFIPHSSGLHVCQLYLLKAWKPILPSSASVQASILCLLEDGNSFSRKMPRKSGPSSSNSSFTLQSG